MAVRRNQRPTDRLRLEQLRALAVLHLLSPVAVVQVAHAREQSASTVQAHVEHVPGTDLNWIQMLKTHDLSSAVTRLVAPWRVRPMNADTHELKTILTLERRYIIPTFQRDYEWTEKGQWALLFEDLEAVADRLEDARRTAAAANTIAKAEKAVAPHFLGAIVLDLLPSSAGSLDMRAVIDGQQRLTTVQLLVRGILDVLLELESTRIPQVRRLIQNPTDVIRNEDDRYKLWPRRRDRDNWRSVMADTAAQGDHLYVKARGFFADKFRGIATAPDGSDRSDVVVDALLGLFKLVVIDLQKGEGLTTTHR